MDEAATINVANDFSKFPGGRFKTDGSYSGERFRDEILLKKLQTQKRVIVELDGTLGYGSSFLEEAFGGLVRECGFTPKKLLSILSFKTKNSTLEETIKTYIRAARQTSGVSRT